MSDAGDSPSHPEFDEIVDDAMPRTEALAWTIEQLRAGRDFAEVLPDLVASGWDEESSAEILETARQATRAERGVVTREQVVRAANDYYSKGTGSGMFAGMPSFQALRRLLYSVATLKFLRNPQRR